MKYRWTIAPPQPVLVSFLARELRISPLLAQCLLNRGLSEPGPIQKFLQPRLRDLADPFLLPHMETAVTRLMKARERRERLVIFGDYDVDGVTATAVLTEVLGKLGWTVDFYLPNRMDEGYGLSQTGVENCLAKFPATLLVAVDCGSTARETVAWLGRHGVDVIVLDHHQVSTPPPAAVALVNPQLPCPAGTGLVPDMSSGRPDDCCASGQPEPSTGAGAQESQPRFQELCSVGLAFKLGHALVKRGRQTGLPGAAELDIRGFLDLVALGTIADIVPVTGENRILVTTGLERLNRTSRAGLLALKEVAGITRPIGSYEVGYQLGPRLNAAGRLENALEALELLLARDLDKARALANDLDARNRQRQQIERSMAEEVIGAVRAQFDPARDFVIVEGQVLWHIGVVGIVASRVLQEFYRPTIILGGESDEWRGSGRSIEGFDLAAALRQCDDLLVRHGGHAMAAGLTVKPDKVDTLRARLNGLARRMLKPEQLQPTLRLDAKVQAAELTKERVRELGCLEESGIGNPPVQLALHNVTHARPLRRMGVAKKHAKLWVTDGESTREAVMWGAADGPLPVGRFDLAFIPQLNEYDGAISVQLKVLDWRPAA